MGSPSRTSQCSPSQCQLRSIESSSPTPSFHRLELCQPGRQEDTSVRVHGCRRRSSYLHLPSCVSSWPARAYCSPNTLCSLEPPFKDPEGNVFWRGYPPEFGKWGLCIDCKANGTDPTDHLEILYSPRNRVRPDAPSVRHFLLALHKLGSPRRRLPTSAER